jgi:hypothetical protein
MGYTDPHVFKIKEFKNPDTNEIFYKIYVKNNIFKFLYTYNIAIYDVLNEVHVYSFKSAYNNSFISRELVIEFLNRCEKHSYEKDPDNFKKYIIEE